MGDMIYLLAAYAVIWVVAFGFIYSMVSRQRTLQEEVKQLEALAQAEEQEN